MECGIPSHADKRKSSRDKDKDRDKKRDKTKHVTVSPELLLAFVYFDQSHTGYLLDKDVEEIMHTLGLHLSRAQVGALIHSPNTHNAIFV